MKRFSSRITAAVVFCLIAVPILTAGSMGCKGKGFEEISRLLSEPDAFGDKDVSVAGRVVRVIDPTQGLLNFAAYQIEDKSGRIWVISRAGAPSVGTQLGLKGRIRQDVRVLTSLIPVVLNESERRTR